MIVTLGGKIVTLGGKIVLLGPDTPESKTYYVSQSADSGYAIGSDSNDGLSKTSPWLTESHALANTNVGDIVWFNAGEYDTINITEPTMYVRTEDGFVKRGANAYQIIGITYDIPEGSDWIGIYEDDNGIEVFETNEPYLLSDGKSLEPPLPVVLVQTKYYIDAAGNPQSALPVRFGTPTPTPDGITWDAGTPWDNGTNWS